jgi:hypothetical protein
MPQLYILIPVRLFLVLGKKGGEVIAGFLVFRVLG